MSRVRDKALALTNIALSGINADEILNAYFNNDGDFIFKKVTMSAKDPEKMFCVLDQMTYDATKDEFDYDTIKNPVLSTQSNFGDIQTKIVEQVITEENADYIEANLINDPRVIGETNCPNISAAREVVANFKAQTLSADYAKSKAA